MRRGAGERARRALLLSLLVPGLGHLSAGLHTRVRVVLALFYGPLTAAGWLGLWATCAGFWGLGAWALALYVYTAVDAWRKSVDPGLWEVEERKGGHLVGAALVLAALPLTLVFARQSLLGFDVQCPGAGPERERGGWMLVDTRSEERVCALFGE